MVSKQVDICDNCHKRTADRKCILCGDDLCSSCGRSSFDLWIRSKDITSIIGYIVFCKDCKEKLRKTLSDGSPLFDEEFAKKISSDIGKYLVKKMLVEKL